MRKNILLVQEDTAERNGVMGGRGGGGGGASGPVDFFNYHCPEKAEALLQKLIVQVKADNTEKKLNTGREQGLEGNVIDVPKCAEDIGCPNGVPGALWELMKRYDMNTVCICG